MAGLAAARARGRSGGRRSKLGVDQRRTARTLYDERALTVAQIGQVLGVSRTSIYRALGQDTAAASGAAGPACCPRSPPRGAEHDFWAPYWHFDVTHAVCGAHLGRELAAAANVDGQADWAGGLDRLLLIEINHTVTAARATGADELAPELLATYRCRYGDHDSVVVGGRSEGTRIGWWRPPTRSAARGVVALGKPQTRQDGDRGQDQPVAGSSSASRPARRWVQRGQRRRRSTSSWTGGFRGSGCEQSCLACRSGSANLADPHAKRQGVVGSPAGARAHDHRCH
jgi:hypothetical protein